MIEGKPIKVFGDGLQLRDFNYVSDVVDALLIAAINPKADGEVFNLGSNEYINLKNLAVLLIEIFREGTYEIAPFPSDLKVIDIGDYYSNYTKINQLLGCSPCILLKDGLEQTLAYYIQNRAHYCD